IPDPSKLRLSLTVNGVVKQVDTTANMIYDVPALIASLSQVMKLEAGEIIATGTPAGVGFARNPKEFLRPDDVMESTIDAIGSLRNRVVTVPPRG
ncbi:MAG: fumarylacetoacetate hydrolase family protein, partial [Chloroflexota bacterium]|nr:fumarylacetoacetate hydrolase family protein [Chloroflexota bacterium]